MGCKLHSGGALQTSIAHHVLERIACDEFLTRVKQTGLLLKSRLTALSEQFPTLISGPIRGRGLMAGLPMKNTDHVNDVVRMSRERGLLILSCGNSTVRFVPSLIVDERDVTLAVDVLEGVMQELMKHSRP